MRSAISWFTLIITMCIFCACTKNEMPCQNRQRYYLIKFIPDDPYQFIPENSVAISAYTKGSGFSQLAASGTFHLNLGTGMPGKYIFLDSCADSCDKYDWRIILSPSGKTYTISSITHHNRSIKYKGDEETYTCSNDLSMKVNDSLYYLHGEEGLSYNSTGIYAEVKIRYK